MEKNIFKNAKFGDKFYTRDGKIALYLTSIAYGIEGNYHQTHYFTTGYMEYVQEDMIFSKYQEPIDEKELDKLALNIYNMCGETPECLIAPEHPNKETYDWMTKCFNVMIWGIKLGYRKANGK